MSAIPAWLTAPEPPLFKWDPRPDPFERYGGHLAYAFVGGVAIGHHDWTLTHEGNCPPGCLKAKIPVPRGMRAPGATSRDWRAFYHGCRTYRPINHSPETLASRGGWNSLACPIDTEPMPLVTVERPIGNPY